jgi:NTE family protein
MTTGISSSAPKLALALSGGGSRAIAFHLGCLKALHETGLLHQTSVISSVSAGSVIAALYCSHGGDFAAFENKTREALARGFVRPALWAAVSTPEGISAVLAAIPMALDRTAAFVIRSLANMMQLPVRSSSNWLVAPRLRRWASRTTILRRVFDELFCSRTLSQLRSDRPKLIIVACELQAKAAFYFSAETAGCWRYGSTESSAVRIAHAVTASASYPAALPALDDYMTFVKDGVQTRRRVIFTDGGVYDNLGLAPLWPGRAPEISLHVDTYDRLVVCRAGYGLEVSSPTSFWPSRMIAVVQSPPCTHSEPHDRPPLRSEERKVDTRFLASLSRPGRHKARLQSPLGLVPTENYIRP